MKHFLKIGVAQLALLSTPAFAQDEPPKEPMRTRIIFGPQLAPSFPGASDLSFGPFVDVSRARGDKPFAFEAPDESAGFSVFSTNGFEFGPALGFQGKRTAADVGAALPKVGFSFEAGAFVQTYLTSALRVRAEARKGVSGHRGWIGEVSADYVARNRDKWLFSLGPRVTLADRKYQNAYFGVAPGSVAASGLPAFRADGGVQSVGVSAGALYQLTPRWGLAGYARYDRLVGDAANSPVTRNLGSRSQPSVGLALSYTFGGR